MSDKGSVATSLEGGNLTDSPDDGAAPGAASDGDRRVGVVFTAPGSVLLLCLVVLPFAYVIYLSGWDGGPSLEHYVWLLNDSVLAAGIRTLIIAVVAVALQVAVSVPLALGLNRRIPGRGFLRALITTPWAVPTIGVMTAFLWLGNPNYGLFNQVLLEFELIQAPIPVLNDTTLALPAVILAHAWKTLPLVFIVVLAALQSLDQNLVDAARVDGANSLQLFRFITWPHIQGPVLVGAVLSGLYNLALFDITFLLTGGGPAGRTTTFPILLYNQWFRGRNLGRASAVGFALFAAGVIALVAVGMRLRRLESDVAR